MHWPPHGDHSDWCHTAKVSGVCHYEYFQYLLIYCDSYMTPKKKNAIPLCLPDDCDLIDVTWTRMFERCPCPSLVICQHVFSRLPVPSSSLCFHLAQVLVEKIETRIGNFFALGVYQTILILYILTLQEYWNHEFHEASALPCSSQY